MAANQHGTAVQLAHLNLDHICSPIPAATQLEIANAFWAAGGRGAYVPTSLEPYFQYYIEQCKTSYHSLGTNLPFSKHHGITELAHDIKQGLTREKVLQSLEIRYPAALSDGQFGRAEIMNGAIDLVARLILMVDVGKPTDRMWTGRAFRPWEQGTINDFTAAYFQEQRSYRHDGIQLDRDFNARNLFAIGGLQVELTNNLLDHLEVVDIQGETTVMIFHHVSFLRNQEHGYFPDGFVHETLQTLALLFPQNKWHKTTKLWYNKHLKPTIADADPGVLSCQPSDMTLNIDEYMFWHDRLVRLKQVYDQAKPRTLRQWWNDRREGTQWYALWVVLGFTVFFGFVQSIEGALQVYKAYHPDGGGGK